MKIQTKCPQCAKTFKVESEYIGRKAKCPACQVAFVVAQSEDLGESQSSPEPQNTGTAALISDSASPAIWISRSHIVAGCIGAVCGVIGTLFVGYIVSDQKERTSVVPEQKQPTAVIAPNASHEPTSVKPAEPKPAETTGADAPSAVEPKPVPDQVAFEAGLFQHKFEIKRRDNKFTNKTSMSLIAPIDGRISVDLFSVVKTTNPVAPDSVIFGFNSRSERWRFLKFHDIKLLLDGELMDLGEARHSGDTVGSGVSENVTVHLTVKDLSRLLNAKKIEVQLGIEEFELKDEHLEAMRDFASRLPTGESESGLFVITHKIRE